MNDCSQWVVNPSDGDGPTFVNLHFHYHYVTTALYSISSACDIAVNVVFLVPSL